MTKTINGLTTVTSAAAGDFLAIWRAANGDTRKITKANLLGAVLTGGGTIATAGFNLTLGATSTITGSITGGGTIATGGFTGTLPATGTLALLATAQTFSALKTFSAGLTFGQNTLNYYEQDTWTPTDGSGAGLTYTIAAGRYMRIGRQVIANFNITWPATANTADAKVDGIPFTQLAIGGTTGGGGFLMVSSYTANPLYVRVITDGTIQFATTGDVMLKNSDLSGKTLRGTVFYDV